jgi:hypothetical protein
LLSGPEREGMDAIPTGMNTLPRGLPMTASPYSDLPSRAYWRSGVAERSPLDPGDIYRPRFPVNREMNVATAGSCFAQHVGRALRGAGFNVIDTEKVPAEVSDATAHRFGYRLFSARYGNIYTARQLAQLQDEVNGRFTPANPVWRRGDRFHDAQRPNVEPEGLDSEELVIAHRERHLACVKRVLRRADLFVFTFGLTETWIDRETETVYPTAPGTIAGTFDPDRFVFRNYDVLEVLKDFERFRRQLQRYNPQVKFLVTVSPVPLTATATGDHVEVATCYSKSVLRAVCGMLVERYADVDYFPSFEIITSQSNRGAFYEPNMRSVTARGVATAMDTFKRAHGISDAEAPAQPLSPGNRRRARLRGSLAKGDVVCEEELLESFAK